MKIKLLLLSFLFLIGLVSVQAANQAVLMGPVKYTRTKGQPNSFVGDFAAVPGVGRVIIANGDAQSRNQIKNATIKLNGKQILGAESFPGGGGEIIVDVALLENNSLSVQLAGSPGAFLTMTVTEELDGLITGIVRDRNTKQPIPNAEVFFYGSVYGFTVADAAGKYTFHSTDLTSFGGAIQGNLYIGATGYFEAAPIVIDDLNAQPGLPVIRNVSLLPGGAVVSGTVRDSVTGQGIGGATVSFNRNPMSTFRGGGTTVSVQTAADGTYLIDSSYFNESGVTSGFTAYFQVNASGHLGGTQSISFSNYPVVQDFSLQPITGELITGIVRDRNTNLPIVNAQVFFYGSAYGFTSTDATGKYSFKSSDLNSFGGAIQGTIYIGASGYFEAPTINIADLSTQPSLPVVRDVTLLPAANVISGTVRDAVTGLGIGGATVNFNRNPMSTFRGGGTTVSVQTAADGTYVIDGSYFNESGLSSGFSAYFQVNVNGYLGASQNISFTGYPVTQDFNVQPITGDIITGTVLDRNTNLPIANAGIFFYGSVYGFTSTDAAGKYSFSLSNLALFGGAIQGTLYIGASGYFEAPTINIADLSTQPSLPVVQNVTLLPAANIISGTVRDAGTGLGIGGVTVSFYRNPMSTFRGGATMVSVQTAADGTYVIDGSYFNESGLTWGFNAYMQINAGGYLGVSQSVSFTSYPVTQDFSLQAAP